MQALLSLEGNMIGEDYDIVVGVSPFPNDNTADFLVLASSGFDSDLFLRILYLH